MNRSIPCEQTDMTKLTLAFRNCLASPKKYVSPRLSDLTDGEGGGGGGGKEVELEKPINWLFGFQFLA